MKSDRKKHGVSSSHMTALFRAAVRKKYNNRCAFCNSVMDPQAHHIVHRNDYLLKWDHRNGILLCGPWHLNCHAKADTIFGREMVRSIIGDEDWNYLKSLERIPKKQYFVEHGLSEREFRERAKAELKTIIGGIA